MNDILYTLYKNCRDLLERYHKEKEADDPIELTRLVESWETNIDVLGAANPEFQQRYEHAKSIISSFTSEQVDWICWQIGDWYLEWQDKMWVKDKPNQHWLGTAKEQLKTMICGD